MVLAVELFLDGVPSSSSHEKLDELGSIRRRTIGTSPSSAGSCPARSGALIREVPRLIDAAADLAAQAGVGPRLRDLISKEGSHA